LMSNMLPVSELPAAKPVDSEAAKAGAAAHMAIMAAESILCVLSDPKGNFITKGSYLGAGAFCNIIAYFRLKRACMATVRRLVAQMSQI
jgi:hypothetical protein